MWWLRGMVACASGGTNRAPAVLTWTTAVGGGLSASCGVCGWEAPAPTFENGV